MCNFTEAVQQLVDHLDRSRGGPGKGVVHIGSGKIGDVPLRVPVVLAEMSDGTVLPILVGYMQHMNVRPWDDERDTENLAVAQAMLQRGEIEARRQPVGFVHTGNGTVN